ncbi:MAG: EAL domain-containing protein [Pseudomonadota bacterium]
MVPTEQPVSKRLELLHELAGDLRSQSQKFVILAAAVSASPLSEDTQVNLREVRLSLQAFRTTLRQLRNCGKDLLADCDPALPATMDTAFSRSTVDAFETFGVMARAICADLRRRQSLEPMVIVELVRLSVNELDAAHDSLISTTRTMQMMGASADLNLALTDDLTGLPNRRALKEIANKVESDAAARRHVHLLHVDLDKFKQLNDTMGHAAGDEALRFASMTLRKYVRNEDFVARVGGDEFVLIFFGEMSDAVLAERADNLIADLSTPFDFEGKACQIGASIGIASCGRGADSLDKLLNSADLALYSAKDAGRGNHQIFTESLRSKRDEFDELVLQIKQGLDANEFKPFFQPQVEGRSGKLVGLESLVRWMHPQRGVLSPFHFLAVAEEAELLDRLDLQTNDLTFKKMADWLAQGLPIPQVSINLSANRLRETDLVDQLAFSVERHNLHPSCIGVEILESAMIEANSSTMIENVVRLGEAGFNVELDDFGTGHASISNLRNFKVDRIKIDKSFVKDVHLYSELSKITSAMIGLAHSLRVDALAEGVETPEERLVLNALGCDHIQGFGVAGALSAEEIPEWIAKTQRKRVLPERKKRA